MHDTVKKTALGLAALGALALGGSTLADAASNHTTTTKSAKKAKARAKAKAKARHASGGSTGQTPAPLTGDVAAKVEAAALAKVPGTLVSSWADADGTYDALVKKSDGTVVKVEIDKDYNVTSVETGGPQGGHGGPHGGPGGGQTPLTGDVAAKVEAAALAKVPGTLVTSWADDDGSYDALVKKSDGTVVKVEVDKDYNVTSVETGGPHGGPDGGRGGRGHGHGQGDGDGPGATSGTTGTTTPQTSSSGYGA